MAKTVKHQFQTHRDNLQFFQLLCKRFVLGSSQLKYAPMSFLNDLAWQISFNPSQKSWILQYTRDQILSLLTSQEKRLYAPFFKKIANMSDFKLRFCYLALENWNTYKVLLNYYPEDTVKGIYADFTQKAGVSTTFYTSSKSSNTFLVIVNGAILDIRDQSKVISIVDFYLHQYLQQLAFEPLTRSQKTPFNDLVQKTLLQCGADPSDEESVLGQSAQFQNKIADSLNFIKQMWLPKHGPETLKFIQKLATEKTLTSLQFKKLDQNTKKMALYLYLVRRYSKKLWKKTIADFLFQFPNQKISVLDRVFGFA